MAPFIFALLFGLPILEIIVFVQAGAAIGWLWVILLTLFTAFAGTVLIRIQGLKALMDLRRDMAENRVPVEPAVDGVFLLLAAPLMMTPGFVTDAAGFAILIPQIRHALARAALRRFRRMVDDGQVKIIRR